MDEEDQSLDHKVEETEKQEKLEREARVRRNAWIRYHSGSASAIRYGLERRYTLRRYKR